MKIQHPAFPDLRREVPDAESDRWLAAGWKAVRRPVAKKSPAVKPERKRARGK